jgi:hypothetical protein
MPGLSEHGAVRLWRSSPTVTMSSPESGTGKVSPASRFGDASGSHKVVLGGF